MQFPFSTGNAALTTWNIGAMTVGCGGQTQGLRFDHNSPTVNPAYSIPFWGLALPTANSLLNGKSQFASMKLCSTNRTGTGDLQVGPAVLVNMGVEFAGDGYELSVLTSTHGWFLQKWQAGTGATLASGAGIVDGDVLSIQVTVGAGSNTIVAKQNSSTLTTQVDNTPLTLGYPGMFGFASNQNNGTLRSEWQQYIGGLGAIQAF